MRSFAPYALLGTVVGLGLGLGANVSGAVLALYGLLAGAAFAAIARASTTRARPRSPSPPWPSSGFSSPAGRTASRPPTYRSAIGRPP